MSVTYPTLPGLAEAGRQLRLRRLLGTRRATLIVGFDHAVHEGSLPGIERLGPITATCLAEGVDGLQVGVGAARWVAPLLEDAPHTALVLRLDHSDANDQPDQRNACSVAYATAESAATCGADAVVAYYVDDPMCPDVGHRHAVTIGRAAIDAQRLGLPLMVEALAKTSDDVIARSQGVLRAARIAFELGADILKVDHPGDDAAVRDLVECVGSPVLLRGGPRQRDFGQLLSTIDKALDVGVRGVVLGRNVWQSDDPAVRLRKLAEVLHR